MHKPESVIVTTTTAKKRRTMHTQTDCPILRKANQYVLKDRAVLFDSAEWCTVCSEDYQDG